MNRVAQRQKQLLLDVQSSVLKNIKRNNKILYVILFFFFGLSICDGKFFISCFFVHFPLKLQGSHFTDHNFCSGKNRQVSDYVTTEHFAILKKMLLRSFNHNKELSGIHLFCN